MNCHLLRFCHLTPRVAAEQAANDSASVCGPTYPTMSVKVHSSQWSSWILLLLQRLYRIITSEELVSPHHSAREMMEVVRNRDFTKLFQKSVKKVSALYLPISLSVSLSLSLSENIASLIRQCMELGSECFQNPL